MPIPPDPYFVTQFNKRIHSPGIGGTNKSRKVSFLKENGWTWYPDNEICRQ